MRKVLLSTVVAISTLTGIAHADGRSTQWSSVGVWNIWSGNASTRGCYMATNYRMYDGATTQLRIGFNHVQGAAPLYLMVIKDQWASIVDERAYNLQVSFPGYTNVPASWPAYGTHLVGPSNDPGLFVPVSNFKVMDSLALAPSIRIEFGGQLIFQGDLPGSKEAVGLVAQCELALYPAKPADPFVGEGPAVPRPAPTKRDPFERAV